MDLLPLELSDIYGSVSLLIIFFMLYLFLNNYELNYEVNYKQPSLWGNICQQGIF